MLRIGVDDAGRGPLLGPMILAGVLIKEESEAELKKLGAKDSKLLSHPERVRLAALIEKSVLKYTHVNASPAEIDEAIESGQNLNTLEAQKMARVINELNDKTSKIQVIIDCPSINIETWRAKLLTFIEHTANLTVVCEHKADYNHPVVSAASILAKVAREEEVEKIQKQYGNIGSGYPADPVTQAFLQEHGARLKDAGIFRKSWSTWKAMFPQEHFNSTSRQKKLFG